MLIHSSTRPFIVKQLRSSLDIYPHRRSVRVCVCARVYVRQEVGLSHVQLVAETSSKWSREFVKLGAVDYIYGLLSRKSLDINSNFIPTLTLSPTPSALSTQVVKIYFKGLEINCLPCLFRRQFLNCARVRVSYRASEMELIYVQKLFCVSFSLMMGFMAFF